MPLPEFTDPLLRLSDRIGVKGKLRPTITRRLLWMFGAGQILAAGAALWAWSAGVAPELSLPAFAAVLTGLGIFFSFLVLHFLVVMPLRDVIRVLDDAANGGMELRLDEHEVGEVGRLSRAVNTLVDKLEARDKSLRRALLLSDLAYRLARVGTSSFDETSAREGVRSALADTFGGMHTWFVSSSGAETSVPAAYRLLAEESLATGGLAHGSSVHSWQVAVPLAMESLNQTVMVLYSAVGNDVPDDAMVQAIASHVAAALASAGNYQRATIDGLTGLHNKQHGKEWMTHIRAEAVRYGYVASLLALDIDHFKKVNDTYGHSLGDEVLAVLAKTISASIREADIGVRNGGEEFLVILPHTTQAQALVLAEKIRAAVEVLAIPVQREEAPLRITVSIGLAELNNGEGAGDWLERADQALYTAKSGGRNKVCVAANRDAGNSMQNTQPS